MITLIYAKDLNNVIGLNNEIPWHIKEDLLFFKEKTQNQKVIVGYKTYMSLLSYYHNKPLPFQQIFLITNTKIKDLDPAVIQVLNPTLFFETLKATSDSYFVIGGASVYELALPFADQVYETIIKSKHEGDTFLNLDLTDFQKELIKDSSLCSYYLYRRL